MLEENKMANKEITEVTDLRVSFRDDLLQTSKIYFQAQLSRHVMNTEVLLQRQAGVAEHPDLMETIEKELEQVAHYDDLLKVIEEYFE